MSSATLTKLARPDTPSAASRDEAEIRGLIAAWSRALEAKDVDGLTAHYAPDALLFDVKPPYRNVGPAAIGKLWADCLPFFPKQFKSEHRDLTVHVSGDLAVYHGLHRMKPVDPPDHPAGRSWVRVTGCFRRVGGRWLVVHEHVSIPFDCTTGQVAPIANPDAA